VESAEALAEYWHRHIRQELGIADADEKDLNKLFRQGYQGSRFSFGYPLVLVSKIRPNCLSCSIRRASTLSCRKNFSSSLSSRPRRFIIHHPEARYFSIE